MKASGLMAVKHLFQQEDGAQGPQMETETQRTQEEEQRGVKTAEAADRRVEPLEQSFASAAPQTRKQEQFRGFALYDDDEDEE
jgi:hypothetical protein